MSFDLPDLPNGWSFTSLESCSQKGSITYGIVQPGSQTNGGVPIIRVNNFRDTRIDVSDVMKVTPEIAAKYERTRLKGGEVLLTVVGTVGQVAVAPSTVAGYNVARAVAVIHPLPHVSAEWIALCLRSPYSQYLLGSRANTTVQTTINLKDLRALPIPLPPERERVSITEMVGAIDDRITLLRETNTTLEAIAQALFKSWFVDFDPVHAKMQGRAPEGMDEATAAMFPDSFEESELGAVPKGWSTISFRDSINVIGGGTPKTSVPEYWGGDIPWFSVVDAPSTSDVFVVDTEKNITEAGLNGSSTKLLPTGTTIISARGTVGRLALTGCPMAMNQSCYGLRGKAGDQYFTYFSTKRLVEQLKQRAHGSVFDTITQETFAGVSLCYPATEVMQSFEQLVEPLLMRIRENLIQSQSLASIRDTLLPRLISGQLPLTTAVEQVNA
jgi:type I restriction enzyme S subunit